MALHSIFSEAAFAGKVCIVTGGGTGIGKAISEELAACGASVIIASRNQDVLEQAAAKLNEKLPNRKQGIVEAHSCNIRDLDSVQKLVRFALSKFGRIDCLVNNAGGQFLCPAEDISDGGMQAVVSLNLLGTFRMCREVYNSWMKEHGGSIVNVTLEGGNGFPMMAHSSAARAGVNNLTKTLAWEWATSGVRVNAVEPGIVYSDSGFANYGSAAGTLVPELLKALPSRRLGTVQETSSAVVWLLSAGASYVSGVVLNVSGAGQLTHKPMMELPMESKLTVYGDLPAFAKL